MTTNRRSFLRKNLFVTSSLLLTGTLDSVARTVRKINTVAANQSQVNITYTNDLKGKLAAVFQDCGGLKQLHSDLSSHDISSLVFDAGGFLNPVQDAGGQLKAIDLMNKINYHAVNLSAADLVQGVDHFVSVLPYMQFQLVSCNYVFEASTLKQAVKPYQIITYGKFKVGVTGVGESANISGVQVKNPFTALTQTVRILREEHQCDIIVCLAHLGFDKKSEVNNQAIAEQSQGVDLFIGGNAEQSKSRLWVLRNKTKSEVLLTNNFDGGLSSGRLSLDFSQQKERMGIDLKTNVPGAINKDHRHQVLALLSSSKNQFKT